MENMRLNVLKSIKQNKIKDHKIILLSTSLILGLTTLIDFYAHETFYISIILIKLIFLVIGFTLAKKQEHPLIYKKNKLILTIYLSLFNSFLAALILSTELTHTIYIFLFYIFCTINTLLFHSSTKYFIFTALSPCLVFFTSLVLDFTYQIDVTQWIIRMFTSMILMVFIHQRVFKFYRKHYSYLLMSIMEQNKNEKLHDDKGMLVKILCHDLSNGLTVINMSTDMLEIQLKNQNIDENTRLNISRIKKAAKEQRELIENIKSKEALDAGKYNVELEAVDLKLVFENIKFTFEESLKSKKINLVFHHDMDSIPWVVAELISLKNQVFNNLISNAIKFSHEGSEIIIKTKIENDKVIVKVIDSGIGMDKEHQLNIFDPTIKTSRVGQNGEKGTGFGLPLVKSFMDSYDAKITVKSQELKGSEFTLEFKLAHEPENSQINKIDFIPDYA